MAERLLLGDEAVGQAALDAGISGCYAYPGTPSTEIMEHIQSAPEARERGVHAQWSANEKTAIEAALGMSYAGKRSLVCMKHVGLNVAADGFVNSCITGTLGGLVVAVADDPSMHSSQTEQDSRFYAQFAKIPCLEPSNQQEAYDMVDYAMAFSEQQQVPVMLRLTTRLAHSRANVTLKPTRGENEVRLPEERQRFILLPVNARKAYARLLGKQPAMLQWSEDSPYNQLQPGSDSSLGIIASGIGYNYLMEAFGESDCPHPILKVAQYPLPKSKLKYLVDTCERILVVEEGAPFIENMLHGPLGPLPTILGRVTGQLPETGELNPDVVAEALGRRTPDRAQSTVEIPVRPPRLCQGCPHIYSYEALIEAMKDVEPGHVFSDIGCYTLGALPPFEAINSCVDMGASISMAKGAADAGLLPSVAVIGDSTFTHSGMTPLLDAVWENTPMTVFILDNGTTGMTGGQDSPATGRLDSIASGLGIHPDHIRVLNPIPGEHDENVRVLSEEIFGYDGVSVVIADRECIQTARRKK